MKKLYLFFGSIVASLTISLILLRPIGTLLGKKDAASFPIESILVTENIWMCGIDALAFAAGRIGQPISPKVLETISKATIGGMGYISVADLQGAAYQAGLDAIAVDMTHPEKIISRMDQHIAAIVHVDFERSGHYIAIIRLGDSYEVLDPGRGISLLEPSDLYALVGKRNTGVAVLVSHSKGAATAIGKDFPLSSSAGQAKLTPKAAASMSPEVSAADWSISGDLAFPSVVSLKTQELSSDVSVPFTLRNHGSEKILIKEIKGSCGCFGGVAEEMPLVLNPAEDAMLHLKFHLTSSERVLGKSTGVLVMTDSPVSPLIPVAVQMQSTESSKPFTVNPRQSLGIVGFSKSISRRFTVLRRPDGGGPMKIDSIDTSSGDVEVTIKPGRIENLGGSEYESIQVEVTLNSLYPGSNSCNARLNFKYPEMESLILELHGFLL